MIEEGRERKRQIKDRRKRDGMKIKAKTQTGNIEKAMKSPTWDSNSLKILKKIQNPSSNKQKS